MPSAIGPQLSISMPSFLAAVRQLCLLAKLWNPVPSLKNMARDALAFGCQSSLWPRMKVLLAALCEVQGAGIWFTQRPILSFFAPSWATRCTDWSEIWHRSPPPCQISSPLVQRLGIGHPKLKFLLRFNQNVEYKCPAGAYRLCEFDEICRLCTSFQDAFAVKISLDLIKGLWSYGGFKVSGSGYPKFSAPP